MAWNFILTDLHGTPQGELLNATDRSVTLPLNKLDTANFSIRVDNPLADLVVSDACMLKVYRDGTLLFYGPVISAEESGDGNTASIAANCIGAGWVLTKRLAGKSAAGTLFTTATDRTQIIAALIDEVSNLVYNRFNGQVVGGDFTNIAYDAANAAASAVTYTAGPYRPIMEIITELSASFDGFDWRILPIDNWSNGALTGHDKGLFYARPTLGVPQAEAIFEWGTGRNNIASYQRTVTRDTQANKVYHFTSNGPDVPGYPTLSAQDGDSIYQWGLVEDIAQADLTDAGLRQQLVNEHVKVRAQPRQTITFVPHIDPQRTGRLPNFGTDYSVGDTVRARAVYGKVVRFDAMMRVWGVNFTLDDNGLERAVLTLSDDGS